MADFQDACGNSRKNPISPCGEQDGQIKRAYFITTGTSFADQAEAKTLAAHQVKIQSGDEVPFPRHLTLEDRSSGVVNEQTPLGIGNVSQGTVEHALGIETNMDLYKRIESYTGSQSQYDVFYQTATGKFIFHKNADGTIGGFEMDFVNTENPTTNDGSVSSKAILHVSLDTNQWRKEAVSLKPDFSVNKLKALSDVAIEVLTASATEITFKINKFSDSDDIEAANPIYGVDQVSDFALTTTAGAAQVIGGVSGGTQALGGIYTATGTTLESGFLDLVDASAMTFQGINGVQSGTVTVV